MAKKLGLIVPYRNRPKHLELFQKRVTRYLDRHKIPYEIIIVEQDEAKLFNRGMLLNIGFAYAKKMNCDYVVFHDVDMVPLHVDYSYSKFPVHLATGFKQEDWETPRMLFDTYFGGVTMFTVDDFEKIDGYSNKYWGWGYEDDDLLLRCVKKKLKLDTKVVKNVGIDGQKLKFNGYNAYVIGENKLNYSKENTIFISFFPDELTCNHEKHNDDFSIFSIPGFDFAISYNSFSRYNFCAFDSTKKPIYVNSLIKTNYQTNITITINPEYKKIRVFQDGQFIGETEDFDTLYYYKKEKNFYIGVGNPEREENPNYFRGYFDKFIIFNDVLTDDEIEHLSNNHDEGVMKMFGKEKHIQLYYNSKFVDNYHLTDLTGNGKHGKIVNCEIVNLLLDNKRKISIPFRRDSVFITQHHEDNGFSGNRWKTQATRWNQLRYYNEVSKNDDLLDNDGLSTLEFVEHGKTKNNNITHINVGI